MNSKDLKKLIKEMVRESIAEIFVEMKLENIVENVIQRRGKSSTISEEVSNVPRPQVVKESKDIQSKEELRRMIMERIAPDDSELASIYKDTLESNNAILDPDDSGKPELVSESALEQMGLMRDYSHLVK